MWSMKPETSNFLPQALQVEDRAPTHFFSVPCGSGGGSPSALERGGVLSTLDSSSNCAFLTPMAQFHGHKLSWRPVSTLDVLSGAKGKVKWNNCPTLPSFYHRREDFAVLMHPRVSLGECGLRFAQGRAKRVTCTSVSSFIRAFDHVKHMNWDFELCQSLPWKLSMWWWANYALYPESLQAGKGRLEKLTAADQCGGHLDARIRPLSWELEGK